MNPDALAQSITATIQTGFHLALGATASLVEDVQDPQRLDGSMRRLTQDFEGLTREWVDRGAVTEQEARNLVASLLQGQMPASGDGYRTITTTADTVPPSSAASELKALTEQIAQLRSELEKLQGNH